MGGLLWCPPRYGWVKFNVSGVANEDEAGCGGVLRDADGVARALFSGPNAAKDSIAAKVGAIIIALDVYLVMGWKGYQKQMDRVGNVSFSKAEKHGNDMNSALALAGKKWPGMFKAWCLLSSDVRLGLIAEPEEQAHVLKENGNLLELVDTRIGSDCNIDEVMDMINIALLRTMILSDKTSDVKIWFQVANCGDLVKT
ncbi:hypothetical protein CXB51_000334 [Gossypium anomalum]|uniref:RNase H type-1 domain-containing protein n=1 Tax=Gossypium anomalum TaxID=47600 RepID=A0A8J5Z444_9ROSI|nr:hypothetical protein CXB51_000334 [Gossypium anomalum]